MSVRRAGGTADADTTTSCISLNLKMIAPGTRARSDWPYGLGCHITKYGQQQGYTELMRESKQGATAE
jgi:hypothetical protein